MLKSFCKFIFSLFITLLLLIIHAQLSYPQTYNVSTPFTLAWNRNSESDLAYYRVYYGPSRGNYTNYITVDKQYPSCELNETHLSVGQTYYIAITALDFSYNESGSSVEISVFVESAKPRTTTTTPSISSIPTTVPPSPTTIPPGPTTIPPSPTTIPPGPTTVPPYTTTTSISPDDDTPPTGTIVINQGDGITYSRPATLLLSVEDDMSGIGEGAQMRFSNDNKSWSSPEPFNTKKDWLLSSGEGEKTVYAKFCDAAGNWLTQPVSDSISLQTSLACLKPVQLDTTAIESSGDFLRLWSKEKAVDGKTKTGWLSPLRLSQREEYIILDLGENRIVNRADILSHPLLLFDLFPLDFQIMLSSDNKNWTEIFNESDYASPSSRTDSWTFEETKARYIKLVITKAKPFLFFFYLTYIPEIEVHGCDITDTLGSHLTSMVPVDHTKTRVVKVTPDRKTPDEKKPSLGEVPPGRPGKPVFILNNH